MKILSNLNQDPRLTSVDSIWKAGARYHHFGIICNELVQPLDIQRFKTAIAYDLFKVQDYCRKNNVVPVVIALCGPTAITIVDKLCSSMKIFMVYLQYSDSPTEYGDKTCLYSDYDIALRMLGSVVSDIYCYKFSDTPIIEDEVGSNIIYRDIESPHYEPHSRVNPEEDEYKWLQKFKENRVTDMAPYIRFQRPDLWKTIPYVSPTTTEPPEHPDNV